MKVLLTSLLALCLLSFNQAAEKDSLVKPDSQDVFLIDSAQLMHLNISIAIGEGWQVIPKLEMQSVHDYFHYQEGDRDFFVYDISAYSFSDTLILSAVADGEVGSSVLTVWKKEGNKYRFISILDKSISSFAHVDSVINLGNNTYLIAGMTEWGDGGDGAGSIWFAVWELPGSFRMIYYDKWFVGFDEDKTYSYKYYVVDNSINLEKLVINYKTSEHFYSRLHTDFKISKKLINIDPSLKIDKTADFNSYADVGEQM